MAKEESKTEISQEELQQSLVYLEQLKVQISTMNEQFEILELAVKEHNQALETLKNFENINENDEMLIPIGADSLVFAKISDQSKVILNVGAGVAIEEKVETAIEKLTTRADNIKENLNKIKENINNLQDQAMMLSQSIEEKYKMLQTQEQNANLGPPNVS